MPPLRTTMHAVRNSIPERCIAPVWRMRPYFAAAAITAFASSTVWVSGFSQ